MIIISVYIVFFDPFIEFLLYNFSIPKKSLPLSLLTFFNSTSTSPSMINQRFEIIPPANTNQNYLISLSAALLPEKNLM